MRALHALISTAAAAVLLLSCHTTSDAVPTPSPAPPPVAPENY
ncbi:hypothetical protein [Streptomyces lincolnensis]|nr:hypothetical protein [Streptomyces lincolnensis]